MGLAVATPLTAAADPKVAPADEYFGHLKMSILGIANSIRNMRERIEADATRVPSIYGTLSNVEDAIHDWEKKYPGDPWIARNLLSLEQVYVEAADDRGRELAFKAEAWLEHDFPTCAQLAPARDALLKMKMTESAADPKSDARANDPASPAPAPAPASTSAPNH
jgi:hypothetical protein